MVHSPRPIGCQIQLGSPDPLWEWHIPTDALFLSEGARRKLRLEKDVPPTMAAFAAHIPPDCLPSLHELLEGVLSGASGPMLELVYPFDDLLVRAGLLIVERNNEGRAVRGVGQYSVSETLAYRPSVTTGAVTPDTGYWQCSLTERTIRMDSRCCALLGYADPRPMVISPEQWRQRLHPEEGIASNCRYQLTLELPQWGDSIEDVLRIRLENGEYARFALHGTVLERDADGHARELAGSLQRIDATSAPARDSSQDAGRLLLAINAAGDGLWDWDAATDEVYYSPRYLSMLGYTAEQFAGDLETWKKKIHPDDIHKIVPPQAALVESPRYGDSFECTYRLMRADGTWAWILGRGYVTHRDAKGRATRLVGLHTDITTTQGDRAKLEDLVRNDALTGLRSRTFFNMEVERIEQNHIRPVSVIACDVNGLKLINDYLGHATGDTLLADTALLLRRSLRATDCIARMGGDEFTILLPSCPEETALKILFELQRTFEEHNSAPDTMPLLLAFGCASVKSADMPLSRTLVEADREMLRQKHAQRGAAHEKIKEWIERNKNVTVCLEDCRYI
ncbi:diguanylate cyclase [uncultured Desulfovibrio sp.]|uniref:sensor domain-containing diguanylate cyclase n=1 Tax=uncultured Desulfovibrio sp. TaxID=167968 RepID=UPI0026DB77B1|nr:diguanylate cyclase [uncultured Desulfovibrio sp.]